MSDDTPQIPASEFVIPFVPDTKAVDDFLDRVEERVERIADRFAGLEVPDDRPDRGAIEAFPSTEPRVDAFPAEANRSDVIADEPRHQGLGEQDNGSADLRRAIEELTNTVDDLRDDIESLTSTLAALIEAMGGGG